MSGQNLEQSRGKRTVAELYNLRDDIAEQQNLATRHPEIVERLTDELTALIARGASRAIPDRANDAPVDFHTIQRRRWTQ